jgi:IS1 family transposase
VCDEIWSFVGAKQKNVAGSKRAGDPTAGDCWTWTAIEAETKLLISYQVGGRDAEYALMLMDDLRGRLANRVQLTTDGHKLTSKPSRKRSVRTSITACW